MSGEVSYTMRGQAIMEKAFERFLKQTLELFASNALVEVTIKSSEKIELTRRETE